MVELILSLAIFISLTAYFIINFNTVNSRIALDNEAHEIALWIREAQAYAMGSRAQAPIATLTYGIHVDSSQPTSFILFVDRSAPRNYAYDAGGACGDGISECIKQIQLPTGMSISAVSAGADSTSQTPQSPLDITFTRPNPDARIQSLTNPSPAPSFARGEISIVSAKGFARTVVVLDSGQISVR